MIMIMMMMVMMVEEEEDHDQHQHWDQDQDQDDESGRNRTHFNTHFKVQTWETSTDPSGPSLHTQFLPKSMLPPAPAAGYG
jgi:hypothetical protein